MDGHSSEVISIFVKTVSSFLVFDFFVSDTFSEIVDVDSSDLMVFTDFLGFSIGSGVFSLTGTDWVFFRIGFLGRSSEEDSTPESDGRVSACFVSRAKDLGSSGV